MSAASEQVISLILSADSRYGANFQNGEIILKLKPENVFSFVEAMSALHAEVSPRKRYTARNANPGIEKGWYVDENIPKRGFCNVGPFTEQQAAVVAESLNSLVEDRP